jgi:methylenetetrahydrofolate reductase (NADPH)
MTTFREHLTESDNFIYTCELVPGRGHRGKSVRRIERFVEDSVHDHRIAALSITDNAGGNPALSADVLGPEIIEGGLDVIVHFAAKDLNRNFMESRAFALQRAGVRNLLVMTGDYPISGYRGLAKPVFDIGSVSALEYLQDMNEGLYLGGTKRDIVLEPTDLYLGAVVSPFKWGEENLVSQYYKLEKKLDAGARYIISQLGYDAKKLKELALVMKHLFNSPIPLLGSVYLLSRVPARMMNAGRVPGCYVPDSLLQTIEGEASGPGKGKDAAMTRAAKIIAVMRGLGFRGAHIEGPALSYKDVVRVIEESEAGAGNWEEYYREFAYAPEDPYYFFDEETVLREGKIEEDRAPVPVHEKRKPVYSPVFWSTRLLHRMVFTPKTPGYMIFKEIIGFIRKRPFLLKLLDLFERVTKRPMFECQLCGDCALFETFYVCPESKCPKGMRIGPCGGSKVDGNCEVFEDQKCIWYTIYRRAKNRKSCGRLRYRIPPRNWDLHKTNAWINYFFGYDHAAWKEDPNGPDTLSGQCE